MSGLGQSVITAGHASMSEGTPEADIEPSGVFVEEDPARCF